MRAGRMVAVVAAALVLPLVPAAAASSAAAPVTGASPSASLAPTAVALRSTVTIGLRTRALLPFQVAPVVGTTAPKVRGRLAVLQKWNGRGWVPAGTARADAKGVVRVPAPSVNEGEARVRWLLPAARAVVGGRTRQLAAAVSAAVAYRVMPAPRTPAAAAPGQVVPAGLFGNHPLSSGFPEAAATVRLWDTGTTWSALQPTPTTWDFTRLDALVADAESHGASVLLVLGGTPAWAGTPTPPGAPVEYAGTGTASPPVDPATYEAYVRTVAERYGARIAAYQVWNEANIPNFFRGTAAQMADLTVRAARAIRAAAPGTLVVAASTGTRWLTGYRSFYPAYLAALRTKGWPVDVFAAHLYPSAAGGAQERVGLLGMVRESLRAAGAPARPLWDTEVNYGAAAAGATVLTPAQGRTAVARTYLDAVRYGVGRVYWYAWMESPVLGVGMSAGSSSAVAYAQVRQWLEGATWKGCTNVGSLTRCTVARGSAVSQVLWTSGGAVRAPRPAALTTVHDLQGGTAAAAATVPVGPEPVLLAAG